MIELGSKVRDQVTNFEGIAIGRSSWLIGPDTIGVQALARDGKIEDPKWFPEARLEVLAGPGYSCPPPQTYL